MNIALIREQYRPDGGAERIVARILDSLRAQAEVHITLLTRHWHGPRGHEAREHEPRKKGPEGQQSQGQGDPSQAAFELIELNSGGGNRLARFQRFSDAVSQVLSQHRFDLIQSHERIPGAHIYRAGDGVHREWINTRLQNTNWLRGLFLKRSAFHRYLMQAEQRVFTHPDMRRIVCISRLVQDDIIRHYPQVDASRLQIIYNGIDLDHFQPVEDQGAEAQGIRQQLGIPQDAPVMIAVGSGFARKGFAAAIAALAQLDPAWQLIIVGKDRRQAQFKRQAQRLGLSSRVHFAGVQTDMRAWYNAADVLVHPALYEPFGNVILEAMACGKAVCASHRCGGAELISPGDNGLLCEPADATSLAAALRSVTSRQQWATMGKRARQQAENHSLDRMKTAYLKLYQDLLNSPSETPPS